MTQLKSRIPELEQELLRVSKTRVLPPSPVSSSRESKPTTSQVLTLRKRPHPGPAGAVRCLPAGQRLPVGGFSVGPALSWSRCLSRSAGHPRGHPGPGRRALLLDPPSRRPVPRVLVVIDVIKYAPTHPLSCDCRLPSIPQPPLQNWSNEHSKHPKLHSISSCYWYRSYLQ